MERKIGELLVNWNSPPTPKNLNLNGLHVSLNPISLEKHAIQLYNQYKQDKDGIIWDYMGVGPFQNFRQFEEWVKSIENKHDPYFVTITKNEDNIPYGLASYMRIKPQDSCIEVGNISYSPSLQNTTHATEAMYLMMNWAFDNGYRRYEWKCNSLNKKSRRAAQRLGFNFEGVFHQHMIVKGRNRDTAWFSITDNNWPKLKKCFDKYLDAQNFNLNKVQKISLSSLTKKLIANKDPSL
jgi:RimJ/RimL family protein N-acetyltransferase